MSDLKSVITGLQFASTTDRSVVPDLAVPIIGKTIDFEKGALGTRANGSSGFATAGNLTTFTNEIQAAEGKQCCKFAIKKGSFGDQDWVSKTPIDVVEGQEFWFSAKFQHPKEWRFVTTSPALKHMRIAAADDNGVAKGHYGLLMNTNGIMANYEATKFRAEFPLASRRDLGGPIERDVWNTYEIYIKLSRQPGVGVARWYRNNKLMFENKVTPTLESGATKLHRIIFHSFYNNGQRSDNDPNDGAPQDQHTFVDLVRWTTVRPKNKADDGNWVIGI